MVQDLRKKLLINKSFQLDFLKYTCGIAAVVLFMFFAANKYVFMKFNQNAQASGLPENHVFFQFLRQQQELVNFTFYVVATIVFITLIIYGLYLSNRIAGPIARLETYLKNFSTDKRQEKMKFRDKDYFKELETPVNELIEKLSH